MFNTIFRSSLFLGFLLLFYSCDNTLSPKDYDTNSPFVGELTVTPNTIVFDQVLDGQKDTTLVFSLSVKGTNFGSSTSPIYSIFVDDNDSPTYQGEFSNSNGNIFTKVISIKTNTIIFKKYKILATSSLSDPNSNYSQSIVHQIGVSINAPEILEVNNPSSITIPSSGTNEAVFEAKVRDIDGQNNIDKVFLNFRNQDGSMLSVNPFEMRDDGANESGDVTANDSVYTRTFSINSSNTPSNRTALYWAIDKSGLSSDTLETPFNIVNNE